MLIFSVIANEVSVAISYLVQLTGDHHVENHLIDGLLLVMTCIEKLY